MKLHIVIASQGDGYHLTSEEPVAAFFDSYEAERHAERLNDQRGEYGPYHQVKECPLFVSPEHCSTCSTKEKNE